MKNNIQIFETDWLGSNPIFFNEKNKKASKNINDVIDFKNLQFHPEGLANYLEWGYSVFGQTPIQDVKFLLPNQRLTLNGAQLQILDLIDPVSQWKSRKRRPHEVIDLIQAKVQSWEKETKGNIIIPASGGYDSRFLCSLIEEKSRAYAYSYGTSAIQSDSYELIYAKNYTSKLGIHWKSIKLDNYNKYTPNWLEKYGPFTHAHGMYQIDFYSKIKKYTKLSNVISGIIGDVWTGKIHLPSITKSEDLVQLGFNHGLHGDQQACIQNNDHQIRNQYYQLYNKNFNTESGRIISALRLKLSLLAYLTQIPESMGAKIFAPFLDPEIALSLLDLDPAEKIDRKWQVDYFRKLGIMSEDKGHHVNRNNNLDQHTINQYPLKPLDLKLLSELLKPEYIDWINRNIRSTQFNKLAELAFGAKYVGYLLNKLHISNIQMQAYAAYLTVLPLEYCLRRREGLSD